MISFDDLKAKLEHLNNIKDPLFKAYQLEAIAKEIEIPVETLKQMLKDYQRQQQEIQVQRSKVKKLFWECELFWEWANQKLSEMDFFNVISRLSIVFGIVLFFYEIPARRAARLDNDKQTVYKSWEIVKSNTKNEASNSGLILALEDLNEAQESLKRIDLSNAQLSNSHNPLDLKKGWLIQAKFNKASLFDANFDEAELSSSLFIDANLMHSKFKKAKLSKSDFTRASLNNANLQYSNLEEANFQEAVLINAQLQKSNVTAAIFKDADIEGANFKGAIGLTVEQIQTAVNWEKAIFDKNFAKKLNINLAVQTQ